MSDTHTIMLVSDGTCGTCEHVVRSALVQFDPDQFELVLKRGVRTENQAVSVVKEAAQRGASVFFTLVSVKARKAVKENAAELGVPTVDVLGPIFGALNSAVSAEPRATPGLLYKKEREYFDRVDAIDFTLKHDDGARLDELNRADVVLVGVSRVSKSSTCFYLAFRGIRASNVPLFADQPPPQELVKLNPKKVIGLTINPQRLQMVRQARLANIGVRESAEYADAEAILSELRMTQILMSQHHWRRIDVSFKAIEEVAREVMQVMAENKVRRARRR
jgi:regulator of PEP synthase PpsR (kinase-PPPase family)